MFKVDSVYTMPVAQKRSYKSLQKQIYHFDLLCLIKSSWHSVKLSLLARSVNYTFGEAVMFIFYLYIFHISVKKKGESFRIYGSASFER